MTWAYWSSLSTATARSGGGRSGCSDGTCLGSWSRLRVTNSLEMSQIDWVLLARLAADHCGAAGRRWQVSRNTVAAIMREQGGLGGPVHPPPPEPDQHLRSPYICSMDESTSFAGPHPRLFRRGIGEARRDRPPEEPAVSIAQEVQLLVDDPGQCTCPRGGRG